MPQTLTRLEDAELPYLDVEDPEIAERPFERVRELAKESWLARMANGYVVLSWEDAKALNRHPKLRTPEGLGLAAQGITEGVVFEWASQTVLGLDGETHGRIRRLAQPGFTPQKLEELRPYAARLFEDILDGVVPAGRGETAEICKSYSIRVICRLLEWPDEDWERVVDWAERATNVINPSLTPEQLVSIEQALVEMREYTTAQLERLKGRHGDDLGSRILAAGEDGDRLSKLEVVQLFETLLVGGGDTTKATLTLALYLFARHPDQWDTLSADPELARSAVEEVLRYRPPSIGTGRMAREDFAYRDLEIPTGTYFIVSNAAANYDLEAYDDPDVFDVRRFSDGRRVPKPNHMSFGFGPHVCIGNYLARVELQEALRILPQRITNLRIDESDPRGVEWTPPFGIHSPSWLPLRWDVLR
jgi:cytochrome P450